MFILRFLSCIFHLGFLSYMFILGFLSYMFILGFLSSIFHSRISVSYVHSRISVLYVHSGISVFYFPFQDFCLIFFNESQHGSVCINIKQHSIFLLTLFVLFQIHDNCLTSLPDEIGQLVNLKRLNLRCLENNFTQKLKLLQLNV